MGLPALTLSGAPGGTAILAGWGGEVRALGLKDGEDLWTHRMQGRVTASPVISAGLVFLASEDGELCALDVRSGAVRWTHQESTGVQATPGRRRHPVRRVHERHPARLPRPHHLTTPDPGTPVRGRHDICFNRRAYTGLS